MRIVWLSVALLVGITNAASASLDFNQTKVGHSPKEMNTRPRSPSPKDEDRMFSFFRSQEKVPDGIKLPDGTILKSLAGRDGVYLVDKLGLLEKSIEVNNVVDKDEVMSLFKDEMFLFWKNTIEKDPELSELRRAELIYTGLLDIVLRQGEEPGGKATIGRVAEMLHVARQLPEKKPQKLANELENIQFRIWKFEYFDQEIRDGLFGQKNDETPDMMPNKEPVPEPAPESEWNNEVYKRFQAFLKQRRSTHGLN